jgi:predicted DNA-binding ribbon-helix-helix protein
MVYIFPLARDRAEHSVQHSYGMYADCMSDTTIRLDSAVRDKLRALADEDHVTLGDLLSRLAEREQYQREMRRANEVMDLMRREDPEAWQEYLSELHEFEAGTSLDGLPPAAAEWPGYNDDAPGSERGAVSGR